MAGLYGTAFALEPSRLDPQEDPMIVGSHLIIFTSAAKETRAFLRDALGYQPQHASPDLPSRAS